MNAKITGWVLIFLGIVGALVFFGIGLHDVRGISEISQIKPVLKECGEHLCLGLLSGSMGLPGWLIVTDCG